MYRTIVYPGALPAVEDLLDTNVSTMIALGYLAQATLGNSAVVDGLAATPVANTLSVTIAPGSITTVTSIDANTYSTLPSNSNSIVKMGIVTSPTVFTIATPSTSGQSANVVIQAQYFEEDGAPDVLDYINIANSAAPFAGPGNSGASSNTQRQQQCVLTTVPGTPATTGSQVTPGTSPGCIGLWIVTVQHGQTAITSGNIAPYPNTPWAVNQRFSEALLSAYLLSATAANTYVAQSQLSTGSTDLSVAQRDSSGGLTANGFHGTADNALTANSCNFATNAASAITASNATFATSAANATTAAFALTANTCSFATFAQTAGTVNLANNSLQLGGLQPSTANTPSTAAMRDSSGDIYCNILHGSATAVEWDDVAERYPALIKGDLKPGDAVEFVRVRGKAKVKKAVSHVFSVVSTNPGLLINAKAGNDKTHPKIVLTGMAPVMVLGKAKACDYLVLSSIAGVAVAYSDPKWIPLAFGVVMEDKKDSGIGLVKASIKRGL